MSDKIKRRNFIKKAAAGTVGVLSLPTIVPAHVLGGKGKTAPSDKVVMGSIGVGGMGTGHIRSFIGYDDVQYAAVCDVNGEHRLRAKKIVDDTYGNKDCTGYNDFRELLARPDIDAVVIATPEHWHVLMGMEAARQGKDMYYEKPLSRYFEECLAIRETVNRYGVIFQHGTQQRSDERFRFACELVRNGRIGKLEKIVIGSARFSPVPPQPEQPVPDYLDYDLWLGPAPWKPYTELRCTRNFTLIYDYSLGCLSGAWGIHHVDIAQWAVDADDSGPVEVEAWGHIPPEGLYDTYIEWEAIHTYKNGVKLFHMDYQTASRKEPRYIHQGMGMTFIGSEGYINVKRGFMDTEPQSLLKTVMGPDEVKLPKSNDHRRNFIDSVKTRTQPLCPVDIAVRSDTVCHQADIAIRTGKKLTWDPESERFTNSDEANRMLAAPMRAPWHL